MMGRRYGALKSSRLHKNTMTGPVPPTLLHGTGIRTIDIYSVLYYNVISLWLCFIVTRTFTSTGKSEKKKKLSVYLAPQGRIHGQPVEPLADRGNPAKLRLRQEGEHLEDDLVRHLLYEKPARTSSV